MKRPLLALFALLFFPAAALAQTGRIAGTITDAATGEPLPGVAVLVEGTSQGAVTDVDGYYAILNLTPDTYTLRVSYVGYATQQIEDVRVSINQTTTIDVALGEAVLETGEVIVVAERPVIQADVSASTLSVSGEEIESLPISSVAGVMNLQAGVQGLSVRGSGADEVSFMLNGLSLRDERDNTPFTGISVVAIKEIQVQTGGFNAEYGNVRSGLVNVVTKEGDLDRYSADFVARYSAPGQKHFGAPANDPNSYWIRPYIDPAVAYSGTQSGGWDAATQALYPEFDGWIAVSQRNLANDNPDDDLSPEALRQAFLWQHRRQLEVTQPDYSADIGFGGPVPGLSRYGGLRFYAFYRREQDMYLIPLSRDRYTEQTGHVRLTADLAKGMKLSVEGLLGDQVGTSSDRGGGPGLFRGPSGIASNLTEQTFTDTRIFATDYWAPSRVRRNLIGARFTHTLNPKSFYELRFTRFGSAYDTNHGRLRDTAAVVNIGGIGFDEAPFGYMPLPSSGVNGMRMGVGMSNARDTSRVTLYNLQGDYTSQLTRSLQVKTGLEYQLTDSRSNYGQIDEFLPTANTVSQWDALPTRGALYGQARLEFRGMIANVGLRGEYFHAGGTWFNFDDPDFNPYADAFGNVSLLDSLLEREPTRRIVTLSPRLGVSFPVTEFSKLYFNYGHFRSLPNPNNLFLIRQSLGGEVPRVSRIADPNSPLPRTISYEAGYEHSLFEQYLVRVAGYYKDASLQPLLVNFVGRNGITYSVSRPNFYGDTRGFEFTFEKKTGKWLQGFINYTYMVDAAGLFGFPSQYENRTLQRDLELDEATRRDALTQPRPRPYARINLDFLSPADFGPDLAGFRPLGDIRASLIARWQAGERFTWIGGGFDPTYVNNVKARDVTDLELRLAKGFTVGGARAQVFMDVYNLLNQRRMFHLGGGSFTGFVDSEDRLDYLRSLHLEPNEGYAKINIPGNDRPGDFRDEDVAYVPMVRIENRTGENTPDPNTIYWEAATESYLEYQDGQWRAADQARVDQVLEDKAYINMPNQSFLTFLNPREVYFGIRFSF